MGVGGVLVVTEWVGVGRNPRAEKDRQTEQEVGLGLDCLKSTRERGVWVYSGFCRLALHL